MTQDTAPETQHDDGKNLIADIITANLNITHQITNNLIDSYRNQAEIAEATLAAIRVAIFNLLDGPYAPSDSAIRRAMYPNSDLVNFQRRIAKRDS